MIWRGWSAAILYSLAVRYGLGVNAYDLINWGGALVVACCAMRISQ